MLGRKRGQRETERERERERDRERQRETERDRERQRKRDRDRYKQPNVHESNQNAQWELIKLDRMGIQRACDRQKWLLNNRPHRLVVRTSRRGRDDPGSTPGVVTVCRIFNDLCDHVFAWLKI